jgi:hypothetical protein
LFIPVALDTSDYVIYHDLLSSHSILAISYFNSYFIAVMKRRASNQKRGSRSGKRRKEAAVEFEEVSVISKRLGKTVMKSRPVRPSNSPSKKHIGPSSLYSQSIQGSRASSLSTDAISDGFTEGLTSWYPEDDMGFDDTPTFINQKKTSQGKVRLSIQFIIKAHFIPF